MLGYRVGISSVLLFKKAWWDHFEQDSLTNYGSIARK